MLTIEQYNGIFPIYVYMLLVLPAVVLGLCGRKSKLLNLIISLVMLALLLGTLSLQMWEFVIFLVCELTLVYGYCFARAACKSEWLYRAVFALSLLPLILVKGCARTDLGAYVGFIGISYISFKVWELIINIHDERLPSTAPIDILGFLLFAPVFSSGPIARYGAFLDESTRRISPSKYATEYFIPGVKKIVIGMFYKFTMAFLINTYIMDGCREGFFTDTVVYMYAYTLYLFFDFAGYSLMAVGTGYLMGIRIGDNFNRPFLARNIKEFWERWHISLSSWFNDYLFSRIVLSGMRSGLFKDTKQASRIAYVTTMCTMGLWHGFYLHYILYGLYHGILLIATDIWVKSKAFRSVKKMRYYDWVSRTICFQFIAFGMLMFSGFLFE